MKDLTEVKFKLLVEDKDDKRALISKQNRYVCAVSDDVLGNNVPCVVLKTSGAVVTQEVVDKLIKKDMIDPINGKKMTESDFIPIQRGGTGFAGSGVNLISAITSDNSTINHKIMVGIFTGFDPLNPSSPPTDR